MNEQDKIGKAYNEVKILMEEDICEKNDFSRGIDFGLRLSLRIIKDIKEGNSDAG